MPALALPVHDDLRRQSRLRPVLSVLERLHVPDLALLLFVGLGAAAAMAFLRVPLRVPGHAILRAVFPLALGLALVPRRGAGTAISLFAGLWLLGFAGLASSGVPGFGRAGPGAGAWASLLATGPLLDLALRRCRGGWRLYLGFAAAGLAANLLAFLARGGAHWLAIDAADGMTSSAPLVALGSYAACGLLAGLVGGPVWFAARQGPGGRS